MDDRQIEARLFSEWSQLVAELERNGFDSLSRRQKVFHHIWMLEGELNNGGFSQYMFNSSGDRGLAAVEALREVGAHSMASICERFFALLAEGSPASDQDTRQAQLDASAERMGEDAFDDACTALEEEFYAGEDTLRRLLLDYFLRAH